MDDEYVQVTIRDRRGYIILKVIAVIVITYFMAIRTAIAEDYPWTEAVILTVTIAALFYDLISLFGGIYYSAGGNILAFLVLLIVLVVGYCYIFTRTTGFISTFAGILGVIGLTFGTVYLIWKDIKNFIDIHKINKANQEELNQIKSQPSHIDENENFNKNAEQRFDVANINEKDIQNIDWRLFHDILMYTDDGRSYHASLAAPFYVEKGGQEYAAIISHITDEKGDYMVRFYRYDSHNVDGGKYVYQELTLITDPIEAQQAKECFITFIKYLNKHEKNNR